MTANTKNSQTIVDETVDLDLAVDTTEANETTPDANAASSDEQQAFAQSQAEAAVASDTTVEEEFSEEDIPDPIGTFAAAPLVPGEFRVPLWALGEWAYHLRLGSRELSDHFHALSLTATEPDDLRPIVVLPAVDDVYPIVDGRFLWSALKAVHVGNEDVEIRCVLFAGTEAEAVATVCDTALGTIEASAMEKAQALYNLQRVNGISQRAIAERYPRLTKDKVSNMLIAARMRDIYPAMFDLLIDPDRAPISYGTDILTLRKAMTFDDFQAVLDRAEDLAANGKRFKPNEAFDALQVNRASTAGASADGEPKTKTIVPLESEPILGHDDQPVAAYERLADNIDRIRLPDASTMTLPEREAAAEACIAQVRRHFGLDEPS